MNSHLIVLALSSVLFGPFLLPGAELVTADTFSKYRDFHLGEPLAGVAKQTGMSPSGAKLISGRPERIEELAYRIDQNFGISKPDSVRDILFRFDNSSLFEILVTYDRNRTGGLSDDDMIEALSVVYGPASAPVVKEMAFNSGFNNNVRVIAQWGDPQGLVRLVGFSYGSGFGVAVSSPSDQPRVEAALRESARLDIIEAPQRELELRAKQKAEAQALDDKTRLLNKPGFRP
jgi:hypothetical protein